MKFHQCHLVVSKLAFFLCGVLLLGAGIVIAESDAVTASSCVSDNDNLDVAIQRSASSSNNNVLQANGCACIENRDELYTAVRQFLADGCSDTNNCNNEIVQQYGWPMGSWCVSNVADMRNLFQDQSNFNDNISSWNVSSVINMEAMFNRALSFNQDLSSWNVSSVINMREMFNRASSFNQDLSSWDVSSVKYMNGMFYEASSFNQDLSSWDVSSVMYMNGMFYQASSFNGDLSSWNTSSVIYMLGMFRGASSFNQDLSSWDVSSVSSMSEMLYQASSFNQDLCAWGSKLPSLVYASDMFFGTTCYYQSDPVQDSNGYSPLCASSCREDQSLSPPIQKTEPPSSLPQDDPNGEGKNKCVSNDNLDVAIQRSASSSNNVLQANGCACFESRNELEGAVNQFIADGCSDTNNCNNEIVQQYGWPMGSWCVSNVTDMTLLFDSKLNFNDNISSWNVSSVITMEAMFMGSTSFNQGLSSWDVSSVTNMIAMFHGVSSFNQDLSSWDVSSVTNMGWMFSFASSFNGDLSSWDVSSVTSMHWMFRDASSFNEDLSSWDVSSVTDMESMFLYASSFNQDLSSWNVSNVVFAEKMFLKATLFDTSAICGWNNGWRKLFGCKDDPVQTKAQSSSASIRLFGQGHHAVLLLLFMFAY